MLFVTLTFNQQNCQHPELHTPAARHCFRPHHPLAATSCGDRNIRPRIDIGSKSCRRDLPSFLQRQIAAHAFPAAWRWQLITSTRAGGPVGPGSIHGDRTPAFISHPKLLISISGGECWSAAFHNVICRWARCTWRSRLELFGERLRSLGLAFVFVYRVYLASSMECLVSGRTVHKRRTDQPPEGPIAWRLPPRGHGRDRGKYPASRTLRADTLPLLNGKDVVSQPFRRAFQATRGIWSLV